jgi:hypothetical protein
MARELSVEGPAMPVRPIDHRRYRKTVALVAFVCIDSVNHYRTSVCLRCVCSLAPAAYQDLVALIKRKATIVQSTGCLDPSVSTTLFPDLVVKSQQRFQNPQFDKG